MDLMELREQIDGIDAQIVALFEQRMDISRQVAEYKISTGKRIFDKQRETEKLAKARRKFDNFEALKKLQLQFEMDIITREEYEEKVRSILQ